LAYLVLDGAIAPNGGHILRHVGRISGSMDEDGRAAEEREVDVRSLQSIDREIGPARSLLGQAHGRGEVDAVGGGKKPRKGVHRG
jgi:hypothetical protein